MEFLEIKRRDRVIRLYSILGAKLENLRGPWGGARGAFENSRGRSFDTDDGGWLLLVLVLSLAVAHVDSQVFHRTGETCLGSWCEHLEISPISTTLLKEIYPVRAECIIRAIRMTFG